MQLVHQGLATVDGDEATGRWYLTETGVKADGSPFQTVGLYRDRYRRDPEGWRFAERRFDLLTRATLDGRGKWYELPGV